MLKQITVLNTDALHGTQITNYCRILPMNMMNFNLPDGVKMPEYQEGLPLLEDHSGCSSAGRSSISVGSSISPSHPFPRIGLEPIRTMQQKQHPRRFQAERLARNLVVKWYRPEPRSGNLASGTDSDNSSDAGSCSEDGFIPVCPPNQRGRCLGYRGFTRGQLGLQFR